MLDADFAGAMGDSNVVGEIAAGEHRFVDEDRTGAIDATLSVLRRLHLGRRYEFRRSARPRLRSPEIKILAPVRHYLVSHHARALNAPTSPSTAPLIRADIVKLLT